MVPMIHLYSLIRFYFAIPLLLGFMPVQSTAQSISDIGTLTREEIPTQISEQVYDRLEAIHEFYAAGEIDEALDWVESLAARRLSAYEETLLQQILGFCYIQKNDIVRAIEAFERTLSLNGLRNDQQQEMRYSLAALYATEGQFEQAVETLGTWYAYAVEPVAADKFMLSGSSYARLSDFASALPYVEEAIRRSKEPNESWYTLELSIHFEFMDYSSAVDHLREMVVLWPDDASYWEMLASAYLELQDDEKALATFMVAYEYGLVDDEAKLLNLARLNLFLDVPYQAGLILDAGLADGTLEETQGNLELLLSAWTSARQFDEAIGVIDRLAPLTDDGAYYMQKAQLLNEQARWSDVVEAAGQALAMGGLDDTASTLVLKGMAQAELGLFEEALVSFEEATEFDTNSARDAEAWIEYVKDR